LLRRAHWVSSSVYLRVFCVVGLRVFSRIRENED